MKKQEDDNLKFVARHWRADAFRAEKSGMPWQQRRGWRLPRWAAAACIVLALGASAAVGYYLTSPETSPAPETRVATAVAEASQEKTLRLEFDSTPLAEVVKAIEEGYGVEVKNLPADTSICLSLSYEGSAADLITTINAVLGTGMTVGQ